MTNHENFQINLENLEQVIHFIEFVWSQYDGGNIDKEQLAKVSSKT